MRSDTSIPVIAMHRATTRMVAAAAVGLTSQPSRSFEPPLQAAFPNFSYASNASERQP